MLRQIFNYFAKDVKRAYDLTSLQGVKEFFTGNEDTRGSGGNFPTFGDMFSPPIARAGVMLDRAVTLTGIFKTVAAFAFAPAIVAVPAVIGLSALSIAVGYGVALGVDAGMKAVERKLAPPQP